MKLFNYLLAGILCASVTCLPAQHRADPQKLVNPESFSMILLGDPQGYTKYDINQPLFDLCTAWIADNIESLKIKAVLCTGDLVEQNDNNVLNRKMLNQTSREMWEAASQALKRLDNKVPILLPQAIMIMDTKPQKTVVLIFLIIFLLNEILPGGISVSVNFLIVKAGRL